MKLAVWVVAIAVVATVVAGAATDLLGHYQRSKADHLLRDLYQIKADSTTYQTARDLAVRYGGYSVGVCTKDNCRLDIVLSNSVYSRLRLARPKEFRVTLFVKDDRVKRISFGLLCSPLHVDQYPLGVGVSVTDESCYPCYEGQKPFLAKQNGVDANHPMQIIVEVTGNSNLDQRRAAYALDLGCLSELGDCPAPDKVAPVIWQEIAKQTGY